MAQVRHIDDISDSSVLQAFLDTGDMKHIGHLYKKYHLMVYGVCLKYLKEPDTAMDASMEIFESMHLLIKKHEITHYKAWLHRVAANHCLMQLRKAKLPVEYHDDWALEDDKYDAYDDTSDTAVLDKEASLVKMEDCMQQLKEHQRICIQLFYMQEKSYQEIMAETQLGFKEVKSFLQNGKLNLKKCMES